MEVSFPGGAGRWELRRSVVRQEGYPLKLIVLSDLSRALREEERQAWKRIIRVLSHEINNSLAPIKSISGSLQTMLGRSSLPEEIAVAVFAFDPEQTLRIVNRTGERLLGQPADRLIGKSALAPVVRRARRERCPSCNGTGYVAPAT